MNNCIQELRTQRNWSQADLAARLDVSRQTINALEAGKYVPSTVLALKLSRLFDKSVNEIFDLEEGD